MAYAYGNTAGPGPSLFRTMIEYTYSDIGWGYRLQWRYYVEVTTGNFYSTNLTTSWAGNVTIGGVGTYAMSGWNSVDVAYGNSYRISAESHYSSSNYYQSTAGYTLNVPRPTYTIRYNANGGTGAPSSQTKTYGYDLTLSKTIPNRKGYTFLGWSENRNATSPTYLSGGVFKKNSSVTLYAVWKRIILTVTYDAGKNGGTTVNGKNTYVANIYYGDMIGSDKGVSFPPPALRKNYRMVGWNTMPDGSGLYVTSDMVVTGNMILYAVFELQANCYVKINGEYKTGMIYRKINGEYKTGVVSVRSDGVYKQTNM